MVTDGTFNFCATYRLVFAADLSIPDAGRTARNPLLYRHFPLAQAWRVMVDQPDDIGSQSEP